MARVAATARILLIGQGPTAGSALESLAEHLDVVGIVRRPPSQVDAVTRLARVRKIRTFSDESVSGVLRAIEETAPDCVVMSSYDEVLPPDVLSATRFVKVHCAPLPRLRGNASASWLIINGNTEASISIHEVSEDSDAGPILFQTPVPIGEDDSATDIYERLNELQRVHLGPTVLRHLGGDSGEAQDHSKATYGCSRTPSDGQIDWTQSTQRIYALIRASISPRSGAFTYIGTTKLFIHETCPLKDPPHYEGRVPGRVVALGVTDAVADTSSGGTIDVLTGDGVLRIARWRTVSGEIIPATGVVTSTCLTLGLKTEVLLERITELEGEMASLRRELQAVLGLPMERAAYTHPCGARAPDPALHSGGLPSAAISFGAVCSP